MPTPTLLVLDLRAEYEENGDTVLVSVFVVDRQLGLGFPGLVKFGTCHLYYRGNPIREIKFDKRFGNGKEGLGDFMFQFSHPPAVSDMQVRVDLDLHEYGSPQFGSPQFGPPQFGSPQFGSPQFGSPQFGSPPPNLLSKTVPVTHEETPYIPLGEQGTTGQDMNGELRGTKRVEEELL